MTRHLIHIGYPKTGSTFLQHWFAAHPQVSYAEGGIAGFRDVYAIARSAAAPGGDVRYRVTSYEGLTAPRADAGSHFVDYERMAAAEHDGQAQVCSTLAGLFTNAVVLVVTRGFRSMVLSSYSQYVRSGGHSDLAELVAASDLRDPWNYDHVLDLYTRAFGAENLIAMPYELLRDDPDRFLRTLGERLGIAHRPAAPERVNPSLSAAEMEWYARLARGVRRLPLRASLRRRVLELHVRAAMSNRLRLPIALLRRLRPNAVTPSSAITDELLAIFRGKAERLRGNPLYAPYASDYLW